MVTTEVFVLETYLAAYAPKNLTDSAWLNTRAQVLDLVRQLAPESEGEAKNLLGALTRYLGRIALYALIDVMLDVTLLPTDSTYRSIDATNIWAWGRSPGGAASRRSKTTRPLSKQRARPMTPPTCARL